MIREQVVITPLLIKKAGQVKHFQVKLPKTAKRIIGVELGMRWLEETSTTAVSVAVQQIQPVRQLLTTKAVESDPTTSFKRNALIGEIRLQSCEEANIFYAGHLQEDRNITHGDFSVSRNWRPSHFTHQTNALEEAITVDGESTVIQGVYKERYGELYKTAVHYLVQVYIWVEREEPEKEEKK